MKRTLLTLALVAAAGTAGAQTVQTPATGSVNTNVTTPGGTAGANTQMNTGAPMNSGTQMNTGTPMNTGAGMSGSANANMAPNLANAPAHMPGAAGTAQKRIEMDGYKNVQGLAKGADGLWHGTAMRGSTQVQVTVDRAGKVSTQ